MERLSAKLRDCKSVSVIVSDNRMHRMTSFELEISEIPVYLHQLSDRKLM